MKEHGKTFHLKSKQSHIERSLTNCSTDETRRDTPDKPSLLRPLASVQHVNDSQSTSPAKSPQDIYPKRREANDASYAYRPTSIDINPVTSQSSFHSTSSPDVSNRHIHTFQGLEPIEEDEMPYDADGNFIMNPLAPPFVPRWEGRWGQGGQLGQGDQPSQGDQQGMLSLSFGTVYGDYI